MIKVSGKTFEHRDTLKELGGRWNNVQKLWVFDYLTSEELETVRNLTGCMISDIPATRQSFNVWDLPPVKIGDDFTYYNYFKDKNPIAYFGFSSFSKFVEHVAALKMPKNLDGLCNVGWIGTYEYTGTHDFKEAIEIARNGWLDGLGMMRDLFVPPALGKSRIKSVAGGSVNVGRLLSGNPLHMTKKKKLPKSRIITVFVECVMWEGITKELAIIRVIIIAAIIDRLEQDGYRCNLVSIYSGLTRVTTEPMQTVITLKQAGEKLNLANLSFAFGHPSFGRRLIYALEGCTPQCNLSVERRGTISAAFDDEFQPGPNEFYIPQIFRNSKKTFAEILETITPENLPVELKMRG